MKKEKVSMKKGREEVARVKRREERDQIENLLRQIEDRDSIIHRLV